MNRMILVAAFLLVGSLALGCGDDEDDPGFGAAGGSGGVVGGGGSGGGGGEIAQVEPLQASVCSDYTGALDRIYIVGSDAANTRCLEVVLASGSGVNNYDLSVPTGFGIQHVRLYDGACGTRVANPPLAPVSGEGEISFHTDSTGAVDAVTADIVLTFDPAGAGGPERLGIELNQRNAPDCFDDTDPLPA